MEIVLSRKAEQDPVDIWQHIAADNPTAADRLLWKLGRKIESLQQFAELGAPRPDIAEDVRVLVEGRYLLIYEPRGEILEIVRVLLGARDMGAELGGR